LRFDLTDLRLFLCVVESGSITGGAAAAHLALASASARIGGMEALLGLPLLERGRRGIHPTPAGRALADHARLILRQVEQMRGDLSGFSKGIKAQIRLLSNTAALTGLLPEVLRSFLARHPNIDIDLEERASAEIVRALAEGFGDFGIVADTVDLAGLEARPLRVDQLVLITACGHALAARPSVAFVEVLDEPFVGLSDGALHTHLAEKAARLGRHLGFRVRLRSFDSVCRLVEAGIGIGIVPRAAAAACLGAAKFAVVPLTDGWAERRLTLCVRRFAELPPHARMLAEDIVAFSHGHSWETG
jgi:DNA-binding transcriptional LysR family regulator